MHPAVAGKAGLGLHLRGAECVAVGFFVYTAILALVYDLPPFPRVLSLAAPGMLLWLARWAAARDTVAVTRARDFAIPACILGAYWQMGWFARSHQPAWEQVWLQWDRLLLDAWGLRALVEQQLPVLAWILELSYLLLYLIPPMCLIVLYQRRAAKRTDRYLLVLAAGTFTTYALLPVLPVESPRVAFAGQDLPAAQSIWRDANVWILDHLGIPANVFPSGHIAVAFSSALGMKRALPGDHKLFAFFLCLACSVYLATIYGRYHYAADGLASIGISLATWGLCETLQRSE